MKNAVLTKILMFALYYILLIFFKANKANTNLPYQHKNNKDFSHEIQRSLVTYHFSF